MSAQHQKIEPCPFCEFYHENEADMLARDERLWKLHLKINHGMEP